MKKRFFAALTALFMVAMLLPMSVFAAPSDPPLSNAIPGLNISAGSISKEAGDTGYYQRLPRLTQYGTSCGHLVREFIPDDYYGCTAEISNPDVISEYSFKVGSWDGQDGYENLPCLEFDYTAGSPGTTTVKLTFYYQYDAPSETGYCSICGRYTTCPGNFNHYYDTVTFTVTVSDGSPTEPEKPSKPTINDVPSNGRGGHVLVKCVTYPNTDPAHSSGDKTHAGYMSLANSKEGWSFGEVVENDGSNSNAPAKDYPWMCKLIVDSSWYLAKYNENYAQSSGTHYLANSSQEVSARFYSDGNNWYYEDTDMPLTVWTTHEVPTPQAPDAPTADQLGSGLVQVACTNSAAGHASKTYDLAAGSYEIGAVQGSETEGYTCAVTVNPAAYITQYSTDLDKTHTTADTAKTITYQWDSEEQTWTASGTVPVVFNAVCENGDPETTFTVTYTDGVKGETVFADEVHSGLKAGDSTPAFSGGTPTREGYTFKGWKPQVADTVTGNATYTAQWEVKDPTVPETTFTVTYTDGVEDEEIFPDQVYSNLAAGTETPTFEGTPTRSGYTFKGWTPEVADTVTGNATYTAQWKKKSSGSGSSRPSTRPSGSDKDDSDDESPSTTPDGSSTPGTSGPTPENPGQNTPGDGASGAPSESGVAVDGPPADTGSSAAPQDQAPKTGQQTSTAGIAALLAGALATAVFILRRGRKPR